MDYSAGVRIIWGIAAAEAKFLKSREIEPEHFVLGLLKTEDILGQEGLFIDLKNKDRQAATSELGQVVTQWKQSEIDCKRVRRRLRYLIQEDQKEKSEFNGHRSSRSRELFASAEEIASDLGKEILSVPILFEAAVETESGILDALYDEFDIDVVKLLKSSEKHARTIKEEGEGESPEWLTDLESDEVREHPLSKYGRDLTIQAHKGKLGADHWTEYRDQGYCARADAAYAQQSIAYRRPWCGGKRLSWKAWHCLLFSLQRQRRCSAFILSRLPSLR